MVTHLGRQRFEPGIRNEVLNDLTRAQATDDTKAASMETAKLKGFRKEGQIMVQKFRKQICGKCMARLQEIRYVWQDTSLVIEVEKRLYNLWRRSKVRRRQDNP